MKTSSPSILYPFKVNLLLPQGIDPSDVQLTVYDAWDQPAAIKQDANEATLELLSGLYTVRWRYAGDLAEQVVRVPQTDHINIEINRPTPTPLSTIERKEISEADQALDPMSDLTSRLYLLVKPFEKRSSEWVTKLAKNLRILDENLRPFISLDAPPNLDSSTGSLFFLLPVAPGRYFLEYSYEPKSPNLSYDLSRLVPLHFFAGWEFRLSMYYHGSHPDFVDNSLLSMVRMGSSEDDPYDRDETSRVEAASYMALKGLQDNRTPLPQEIERGLLNGKFENPLLGLLGAHYLLRHPPLGEDNNIDEGRWRDTAQSIIHNLQDLLPDSPDVMAIRFKAAQQFADDPRFSSPAAAVAYPPMLRASLEALLDVDSTTVYAIAKDSLIDYLSSRLYHDSPLATYRPLSRVSPDDDSVSQAYVSERELWLENTAKEVLELSRHTGHEPDLSHLATSLGISYRRLTDVIQQVVHQENDQIRRLRQDRLTQIALVIVVAWAAIGTTFVLLFWKLVIMFIIFGLIRGWRKEIFVTCTMILALTLNYLLRRYVPLAMSLPEPDLLLFWLRMIILLIAVFFGYQTVFTRERLQNTLFDSIPGAIVGALNGYLILTAVLYYVYVAKYPLPSYIIPLPVDPAGMQLVELAVLFMSPQLLFSEPSIYLVWLVIFLFALKKIPELKSRISFRRVRQVNIFVTELAEQIQRTWKDMWQRLLNR